MNKKANTEGIRKLLKFSGDSSVQMDALSFLENGCGRKQSLVVALAVSEFAEKYHLKSKTTEEIRAFLTNYDVIKNTLKDYQTALPLQFGFSTMELPSLAEPSEEPAAFQNEDDDFKDIANSLSAAFLSH